MRSTGPGVQPGQAVPHLERLQDSIVSDSSQPPNQSFSLCLILSFEFLRLLSELPYVCF